MVGIEAGIGGDEFAVDADAGAPGMAFFAGILVDTDVHGLGFQLRAGFYPVCPTAARQGSNPAAAAVVQGRIQAVPHRVVGGINAAVQQAVGLAGALVVDCHVFPVWMSVDRIRHLGITPGHIGRLHIGQVDGFQAVRAAQAHGLDFARVRVRHVLPAPPAFGLQYRRQLLAELLQGLPAFGGFDHGGIDVADHIHAGGFGHGEGGGVRIIQHVLPVP